VAYNQIVSVLSQQFLIWDNVVTEAEMRVRRALPGDDE
jgi:hypothetical protein